ncbi:MAG TPA: FtsW/RodA/SpoVE family cell cycle protein [Acidimicrobiia bacterium]|nr:FtsW/RodA/SpoVE family cell cycle protein [Acidimicrobiia bacterium]
MTRSTEIALVIFASFIAAAGTALVSLTADERLTIDTAAAFGAHLAAFGGLLFAVRRWTPGASRVLLPPVAFVTALGVIEVFRIDRDLGRIQRWWLLVAAAIAAVVLYLLRERGLEVLRRFRYLWLAAALALLVLPLTPSSWPLGGSTVNGSRLWVRLDLGERSLSFQPGEGAKILLVVFLASFLADRWQALAAMPRELGPLRLPEPRQLVPVFIAFGVSLGVLAYQRDLGASLLLFVVFVLMLFAATDRPTYLVAGGALAAGGAVAAASSFDHVAVRVDAWLHPFEDFAGGGYQVAQSVFSLADAGILGSGIGNGQPYLIPAAATDYVFVAIAEEMGLAGGLAMLAAYAVLVAAGFGIALRAADRFRSLLAAGLTIALAVQTLLILAGVLRLLPLTGITLPFASYGGSSLLANMVLIALLARVSHEERT